jgi:hypothetical protein
MKRVKDIGKKLEEIEAAIGEASKPKQMIVGSSEWKAEYERRKKEGRIKTAAQLDKEMEESWERDRKEYEQIKASPEHKRLMLEQSEEGHRYRQSWFQSHRAQRCADYLISEGVMEANHNPWSRP